jgi:hypothetical protein
MTAYILASLARITRYQGNDDHAAALFRESLVLCQEAGDKESIADCLEGWAGLRSGQGRARHAAQLYGAAAMLRADIGAPLSPAEQADYERDIATIHAQLTETVLGLRPVLYYEQLFQ